MRRAGAIFCAVLAAALALAATAHAEGTTPVPSGFPVKPSDYEITPEQAVTIADGDPKIIARKDELTSQDTLSANVKAEAVHVWEVGYYLNGEKVNLVIVDGESGAITQSWTGPAVDWPMARGKPGQFGHILNSPWVWIPLAAVFLFGLFDFRRPRKWVHLDLLVLLAFGISQAFFNAAEIGTSVPIAQACIGRAFLAACTPPEREAVLNQMKVKEPELHRKYRPQMDKAIEDIRMRGFCVSYGELRREIHSVGVPMRRTVDGEIVAFNCSVPSFVLKKGQLEEDLGPRLVAMVRNIEAGLGMH